MFITIKTIYKGYKLITELWVFGSKIKLGFPINRTEPNI